MNLKDKFSSIKIVVVLILFASGCATSQKFLVDKKTGQWEAKLKISDFNEKKIYSLDMSVIAEKPDLFRAEISGSLGIAIASILLKGRQLSYAAHRTKSFYSGLTDDQALKPVLQVGLDPKYLMNVFFDDTIEEYGWNCKKNQNQVVESCLRETDKLFIEWFERSGESKRVLIRGRDFEVQIVVKSFQTKVQNREKVFELSPPNNYKFHNLNK